MDIETLLNSFIDKFDGNMVKLDSYIHKSGLNDQIQEQLRGFMASLSAKCFELEQQLTANGTKDQLDACRDAFRKRTFKWFMQSRCIKRSFEKPQGYAGDFEIIDWIYQNKPEGKGIGFALDRYFLDNKGSQAMRSRKKFLVNKITGIIRSRTKEQTKNFSIFDLGCGPGRDILEIFEMTGPARTILMDQDKDALNYCKNVLKPYLEHIEFVQYNLLRIVAGEKYVAKKFGHHDVVMCIGLYDYLDEDSSVRLLRSSYNLLKENGTLAISNWDTSNPSKTELEWVCDWHLYHRTGPEMMRIIEKAGVPSKEVSLEKDPTGHFHMAFINKP